MIEREFGYSNLDIEFQYYGIKRVVLNFNIYVDVMVNYKLDWSIK